MDWRQSIWKGQASVFLNIGKLFATLRGIFEARTSVATLAAKGTEFQVEIDGPQIDVLQLDGEVVVRPVEPHALAIPNTPPDVFLASMQQPAVAVAAGTDALTLARLQHLELKGDGSAPRISGAEESRVAKVIDVNANVILSSRPSIPSQSLIPNFSSNDERDRVYRSARFQTIWSPEDRGYFQILGNVYVDWADPDRALRSYRSMGKPELADHDLAVYFANTGDAYRMSGGIAAAAEKLFARARELDPKFGPAYTGSGDVLFDQAQAAYDSGNVEKATLLLNDAQEFYLKSLDASLRAQGERQYRSVPNYHLGEIALSRAQWNPGAPDDVQHELDLAQQHFKEALELSPDYAFAHVGLGRAASVRSIKEARAEYELVLRNHPAFALASLAMGESYEQEGDWKTALRYFRQATQSDPDYPLAYYKTGLALQKLGDPVARNYFGVYLQIESPLYKDGGRTKRALEAIASDGPGPDGPTLSAIPSVAGITVDEAEQQLRASGFRRGSMSSEPSEVVEKGLVIRQEPTAGTKANAGKSVDLWLSAGAPPPPVRSVIPSVTGIPVNEAEQQLHASGFRRGSVRSEPSEVVERGLVIRQDPPARTDANPGQSVDLWLSAGAPPPPPRPVIPSVTGITMNEAVQQLQASGFSRGLVRSERNDVVEKNLVFRQEPPAGMEANPGQSVDLWISTGRLPESIVPPVVGMKTWQAGLAIGLSKLRMEEQEVPSAQPRGNIFRQDPPAGARVPQGTGVTVYVSSGNGGGNDGGSAVVPKVTGLSVDLAMQEIRRAGLVGNVSPQAKGNTVGNQEPPAGTKVSRGSSVMVYGTSRSGGNDGGSVVVPNVTGLSLDRAMQEIKQAGLVGNVSPQTKGDTVGNQDPPAGTRVPRGSSVMVYVTSRSGGNDGGSIVVPNVIGLSLDRAIQEIKQVGLVWAIGDGARGHAVRSQEPRAGTKVPRGSKVMIYVDDGGRQSPNL